MEKFFMIKDVELNDMKKRELEETNGGWRFPGGMCGLICYPPEDSPGTRVPRDIFEIIVW